MFTFFFIFKYKTIAFCLDIEERKILYFSLGLPCNAYFAIKRFQHFAPDCYFSRHYNFYGEIALAHQNRLRKIKTKNNNKLT